MNNNYIEFKKKRELGDILTDTFAFLRQNFKSLFSVVFKIAGIPFLLLILSSAYYSYASFGMMDPLSGGNQLFQSGNILIALILMLIFFMVFYGLLYGSVLHYIKSYIERKGEIDQSEIIQGAKKDFGSFIGLGILSSIIMVVGFILCFIPGIYLYVPMSLTFSILVFRKVSVTDAISDSFQLIKNEWWITFATLLVIGILVYIVSMIFSVPMIIYTFTKAFTVASEGSMSNPSELFDWVFIVLNSIANAAQYILYIITTVATAFIYFNLNERKHFTGTLEQIDSLGKSE